MFNLAGLVAVGDEVLSGEVINSNAAWLAQQLLSVGIHTKWHMVVGDDVTAISQALEWMHQHVDLVIVIGGLGPTADDLTKDAVARYYHRDLIVDSTTIDYIAAHHGRNIGWQESVSRQAQVITGATVWQNPHGQAPGQLIEDVSGVTVLLPGPPRELQGVARDFLLPWLRQGPLSHPVIRRTLTSFDMDESVIAHQLLPLLSGQHPKTGIYARPGQVDVRVESSTSPQQWVLNERAVAWIKGRVTSRLYELTHVDRTTVLIETLSQRQETISAMESLTGGLFMATLINVPGASLCVAGGAVAYTDRIKALYGVPVSILEQYGAVSAECALAMAQSIRQKYGTHWGVSTTGYAGPGGGDSDNPVGTFYTSVAGPKGSEVRRRVISADREGVREAAVEMALTLLWDMLGLSESYARPNFDEINTR
ncbi:nicotinamide-nucleotide amidase [Sulfobacillus thermosulfidooxidans DSM 9293]|uniref:Putative competence-damage inducible protein n=2 Tax=Sulfobacillus thermosulfidooxidans TaxID=28034 RepID=A0A1W1WLD6_SULTA|nr:CinA family nicotinamide mononucleotide deamidase-related protein [Sulfobacillus thermosulfidooxidans]PSR29760.1 MAG: damage-inducible protein CinA [Sulfobacillus thermosulfidooxidans]SMC07128.1 nicotinamide-nucleotide amidase [Sulfobacillus thermosulfidooxidans DSM 9293]